MTVTDEKSIVQKSERDALNTITFIPTVAAAAAAVQQIEQFKKGFQNGFVRVIKLTEGL